MYTLGCPAAPTSPPPSHATMRSCVHRTGSLWISSIAAYGCGYVPQLATIPTIYPFLSQGMGEVVPHTCNSKSVCSNLGPTIASARGFWLRDQISARFGACTVGAAGTGADVTGLLSAASCVVWAVVVGEEDAVVVEEWRRVVRTAARRGSAARRRVAAVVSMVGWSGVSIEGWFVVARCPVRFAVVMLPGRVSGDLRDEMKLLLAAAASSLGVPRGVVGGG